MREKDWLVNVLSEASKRVESWPDWKKSSELADTSKVATCKQPDSPKSEHPPKNK